MLLHNLSLSFRLLLNQVIASFAFVSVFTLLMGDDMTKYIVFTLFMPSVVYLFNYGW